MEDLWLQLGVGGTFAVVILREVFGFVSKRNEPKETNGERIAAIETTLRHISQKIDDLYDWHNVVDPVTGVKIWYTSGDLYEVIQTFRSAAAKQTELLHEVVLELRDLARRIGGTIE